jgi:DNA-binding LytR/AlgR family response regulator
MKRWIILTLLLLSACGPTPQRVTGAMTRGNLDEAVQMMAQLINEDEILSIKRLNQLLTSLRDNKRFSLDHADELMDRLKATARPALQPWYTQSYLEAAEAAIKAKNFDTARAIWKRHQKVAQLLFPNFQEKTPVLGIIDLREAEVALAAGQKPKARQLMASARKKLTTRKAFDKVDQYVFKKLVEDLQRKLK